MFFFLKKIYPTLYPINKKELLELAVKQFKGKYERTLELWKICPPPHSHKNYSHACEQFKHQENGTKKINRGWSLYK